MREKHATDLKTLVDEIHGLKQKIEKNKKLKKLKKKQKIPYGISVSVGDALEVTLYGWKVIKYMGQNYF